MKKRALSLLLAFALCFTMFAGIGSAAVSVDRVMTAAGNILDNVAQDADAPADQTKRIDVIKAVAGEVPEVSIEAAPWDAFAAAIIKDEAINDTDAENPEKYPYFLLRYLADPANGVDLTDKDHVKSALEALEQLDAEINTANEGIKASIDKFGPYADKLTEIVTSTFDDQESVQELADLGIIEITGTTPEDMDVKYIVDEKVIKYAKSLVLKAVQYAADIQFATSSAELDEAYAALMADDLAKKNAALFFGEELLEKLLTGQSPIMTYLKGQKDYFKKEIIDAYLADVFSADKATTVNALAEISKTLAAKLDADGASSAELSEMTALLNNGPKLTFAEMNDAYASLMTALDADGDFRAVYFDLAVNRALKLYNTMLTAQVTSVQSGQPISFGVYHSALKNRFGIENAINVTDRVYVTMDEVPGITLNYDEFEGASLEFDEYNPPADSVKLHVYRGTGEENADVYRYIKTFDLALQAKAKTIALDKEDLRSEYLAGSKIVIKGTSEGFKAIVVSIADESGAPTELVTLTPEQFEAGYEYTVPADADGTYTILVGETGATDSFTFKVVKETVEKYIKLDPVNETYAAGDTLMVKGTSENFDGIVVTVINEKGEPNRLATITAAEFAKGFAYTIPETVKAGEKYTIMVGDNDKSDSADFTIVEKAAEKKITIDKTDLKAKYAVGDSFIIKGTSENFNAVVVTVIDANGKATRYATLTPADYAENGVEYTIPETAKVGEKYTIMVGENGVTDSFTFEIASEEETKTIAIDKTDLKAEYAAGDSFIIKGTSENFNAVVVTVIDADGKATRYTTASPEQFAEGIAYAIPTTAKAGETYTIMVGENGVTDSFTFTISGEVIKPEITIEDLSGKQYALGGKLVIKGTVTGMDEINLVITDEGGNEIVSTTISAKDYANGYELTLDERFKAGNYTITAGNGEVSATTTFLVGEIEKWVKLDGVNATYVRGQELVITGKSVGFNALVITVVKPDGDAYRYATIAPEELVQGFKLTIGDDADLGTYTVTVGENGELNDSVTFEVVDETDVIKIVKEGTVKNISAKKNTAWADLKLPETIILTDENGNTIEVPVTWNSEDYDPASSNKQVINGTYTLPAGYIAGNDSVDGMVTITVSRPSSGGGGGGRSPYVELDKSKINSSYTAGESILIKGDSYGYKTIKVKVTAPDGTVKEMEISADEFKNGYNLSLAKLGFTKAGKYTIDVEGNRVTIDYAGVTSDIFNKGEHMAYILGYEDGTVRPEANITREEVTAILYRLLKEDSRKAFYKDTTDKFSDVENGRWSMASVATLTNVGILKGYEDGTFKPGKAITRAEFAALCSRLAAVEPAAAEVTYSDVKGHWAENDIYVVSAEGWFKGDTDGKFRPEANITRAEAITVINRMLGRDKTDKDSFGDFEIAKFSDLKDDAWYYVDVVEATNAHGFTIDEAADKEAWVKEGAKAE